MGVIKAAIGDALLTSMWEFSGPFLKIFTIIISTFLGVPTIPLLALFISTIFNTIFVLTFSFIANLLGGASFNPSATLSLYAADLKPDASLMSIAVRFPAQVAGGVGGVKAIIQFMPTQYRHMFKGSSLKVDLHTGAGVEGILTFLRSFALLVIMLKGPKSLFLQVWLVGVVTVGLVIAGSKYTGAYMNPAKAYGWAYLNNWHNTWEFFYVYWVSPLTGAVLASWVFKYVLSASSSVVKQKKA